MGPSAGECGCCACVPRVWNSLLVSEDSEVCRSELELLVRKMLAALAGDGFRRRLKGSREYIPKRDSGQARGGSVTYYHSLGECLSKILMYEAGPLRVSSPVAEGVVYTGPPRYVRIVPYP